MSNSDSVYSYDLFIRKENANGLWRNEIIDWKINRGKGVLLIYDMGSVKIMGKLISKETGIDIRFIAVPSTMIALETVKDEQQWWFRWYYVWIRTKLSTLFSINCWKLSSTKKKNVIITLCMNGEGGAIQIKNT